MSSAFIPDDGYTEEAFVAGVDRLYPAVRFSFRPMLTSERVQAANEGAKTRDDVQAARVMDRVLAAKLVSWDVADDKGKVIPINPANVGKLKPRLRTRLFEIVNGNEPSDPLPDTGETPAAFDEAASSKN